MVTLMLVSGGLLTANASEWSGTTNHSQRTQTTRTAMLVLGGWAGVNIAAGSALYFTSGNDLQRFHEMNVLWNVVNLGIALGGLLGDGTAAAPLSISEAIEAQRSIESALLLNIGLDVAYMAAGWALLERGQRAVPDASRWTGYGASLLLQGGFLFLFDIGFYLFQLPNRPFYDSVSGSR